MIINIESYIKALKSPTVDTTDAILLSLRILENEMGSEISVVLAQIEEAFARCDYDNAISLIKTLIISRPTLINEPVNQLILSKISNSEANDNPYKNQSRRYFDTHFSQSLWNAQTSEQFSSIEKLTLLIAETSPEHVTTTTDAEKVIASLRYVCDRVPEISSLRESLIVATGSIYYSKDRGSKKNFLEPLLSNHPGVVKANSPLPLDEHIPTMKNRITDTFEINTKKIAGYSSTHLQVPFVNSVSGTTYDIIAILAPYIKKHRDDLALERDVNHILNAFLAFTCLGGFHSIAEMQHVLLDREIQKIFRDAQIKIYNFPQKPLKSSIVAASDYARSLNLKQSLNEEIRSHRPVLKPPTDQKRKATLTAPAKHQFVIWSNLKGIHSHPKKIKNRHSTKLTTSEEKENKSPEFLGNTKKP